MSQGIDASGSQDFRRQMADHFGVEDDIVRNHAIIDDALFRLFFRDGDNGIAGCFRTGPASRRDHQGFDIFLGNRRIFQQVADAIVGTDDDAGQLSCIHDAAAAYTNDQVDIGNTDFIDDAFHILVGRFRSQIVDNRQFYSRADFFDPFRKARSTDRLIGKQQDGLCLFPLQYFINFFYTTRAGINHARNG